jgi:predicted transcriptional regulator
MEKLNNNLNYRLAKGILDMLLENKVITLEEYEEIDKRNKLSFA